MSGSSEKDEGLSSTSILLRNVTLPHPEAKQKRRTRNSQEGRQFKCSVCERTYLSYPALYTHMKTKHAKYFDPSSIIHGRARGRPKKSQKETEVDPSTFAYFTVEDRAGETTNVDDITQVFTALSETSTFQKYKKLFLASLCKRMKEESPTPPITCDEIFIHYLSEVAKVTQSDYFQIVTKFILLFRECINEFGWIKLFAKRMRKENEEEIELSPAQVEEMKVDYCAANNAEFIPELFNELLTVFLQEHCIGFPLFEGINLSINFSEWLLQNGYTCTKISLIKKL